MLRLIVTLGLMLAGTADAALVRRATHGPASRPAIHLAVGRLLGVPHLAVTAPGTHVAGYLAALAPIVDQHHPRLGVVMVKVPSSVLGPRVLGGTFMVVRLSSARQSPALRTFPRVSFAVSPVGGALALSWRY
jgi:hypothetical protein